MKPAAHALLGALFLASLAFGLNNPYLRIPPWAALCCWSAASLAGLWLERRSKGLPWHQHRPALFLFLLALTAYLATFRWHGGDDIPNTLLSFCLLRHGTLSMEPFRDWFTRRGLIPDFTVEIRGQLLSVYPIGPGILALPIFAVSVLCGNPPDEQLLHNLAKISGALICALSVVVVFSTARSRASRHWALCVASLYAFGTYTFSVASQALWSHGPALLGTALGLWGALSRTGQPAEAFLSGLGLGLAAACRPDSVLFLAPLSLYWLLHRRKSIGRYLLGAAVPLGLNAVYWLYYVGRLRPPESQIQVNLFGPFQSEAFWGMLASPTRGLLFFTPAALLGFWGMARAWRQGEKSIPYLLAGTLATWVFFCFRVSWTGGETFGNRYFSVVSLIPMLFCADIEEPIRRSRIGRAMWAAAFAASVLIHTVGAFFTWPGSYVIEIEVASLWNLTLHPLVNLFTTSGALGTLPTYARVAAACVLFTLAGALARAIYHGLKPAAENSWKGASSLA